MGVVRKDVTEMKAFEMDLEGRGDVVTKADITRMAYVPVLTRTAT